MRIVALGAREQPFLSVPEAHSLAVCPGLPRRMDLAVALTAENVGLIELDGLSANQSQSVRAVRVVAVKAPFERLPVP